MSNEISLTFGVENMTCASCVARVERALAEFDGVVSAHVNLATESARVEVKPSLKTQDLASALQNAGYPALTTTHRLGIEGMTCASCVGRIERAFASMSGVITADVNLAQEQ